MQQAKIYNDQNKSPTVVNKSTNIEQDGELLVGEDMDETAQKDTRTTLPQTGAGGMNDIAEDSDTLPPSKNIIELESGEVGHSNRDSNDIQSVKNSTETTNVRDVNDSDDEENNPEVRS